MSRNCVISLAYRVGRMQRVVNITGWGKFRKFLAESREMHRCFPGVWKG